MAFILRGSECQTAAMWVYRIPWSHVALDEAGSLGLQLGVPRLFDLRKAPLATPLQSE
jgi:hypothetical protein